MIARQAIRFCATGGLMIGTSLATTISGFVREAGSGEPLASVVVTVEGTELGTLSEDNGYYVLHDVPAGMIELRFSTIGYESHIETLVVTPSQPQRRDVRLKVEPVAARPIEVTAERARFRQDIAIGVHRLRPVEFKIAPGFIEQDLFKSLQVLPGIVTISDFSSALYVRGGSPDQNLVLLDGVEIYNPYHLGGLFSTFTTDALSNAELHNGAFPAQYGNAVSSVLDVELRQGNCERIAGS
ncbi:MAG: TonB-dependent receptor, partial [candidate division WOR-3 bacterium]